ncbi:MULTISPECIES: aldo/keto reductase [unclassified Exiguobacterium]|uniref:aldo/keto reductase n=1 Tax=unclassified Exiguobacterium TaxID=2644629 RepID=UPI000B5935DF|nr:MULTISPECIES: aldo/keto reductase [unclassified Exiguobacterium]ASI34408.1 aldo/keto reductase [Exiguobacterium sp. N4-1P]
MQHVTLNNGLSMPQLGYGVFKVPEEEVYQAVLEALRAGYRSIDTAMIYENEAGVGRALRDSGIPREEIFLTTKVWNADQGYAETLAAFETSLTKLGVDYVDLYLIHWPMPNEDRYVDTWHALEELYKQGKTKAIGVSNFHIPHLKRILEEGTVVPAVNQIELHPFLSQEEIRTFCKEHDILVEAWSPLMKGRDALTEPVITDIATTKDKTPAQVILRWHIQHGIIAIPKSVTPSRIRENLAVFDFELSAPEMQQLDALNQNQRTGSNPDEMHKK